MYSRDVTQQCDLYSSVASLDSVTSLVITGGGGGAPLDAASRCWVSMAAVRDVLGGCVADVLYRKCVCL